jgi:hypothetical protein
MSAGDRVHSLRRTFNSIARAGSIGNRFWSHGGNRTCSTIPLQKSTRETTPISEVRLTEFERILRGRFLRRFEDRLTEGRPSTRDGGDLVETRRLHRGRADFRAGGADGPPPQKMLVSEQLGIGASISPRVTHCALPELAQMVVRAAILKLCELRSAHDLCEPPGGQGRFIGRLSSRAGEVELGFVRQQVPAGVPAVFRPGRCPTFLSWGRAHVQTAERGVPGRS